MLGFFHNVLKKKAVKKVNPEHYTAPQTAHYVLGVKSEERRRRAFYAWCFLIFSASLFIIFLLWIFLRSPFFRIREFEIEGNHRRTHGQFTSYLYGRVIGQGFFRRLLGARNLLLWPEELSGEDLRFLPDVKSITLEKDYLERSLRVNVQERPTHGIWCARFALPEAQDIKTDCYWFDDEGYLFGRAPDALGNLITVVHDYSSPPPSLYRVGIPREFRSNLFSIFEVLRSTKTRTAEIRIENWASQEVVVRTISGPTLLFSLRFPADATEQVISKLRRGEVTDAPASWADLGQIDFRVENRAYFKR